MKTTIITAALLTMCSLVALARDNGCPSSAEAVSICTILSSAEKFDGKDVTVKGRYRMVLHGSILTADDCKKINVNTRQASDYKADKRVTAEMRSLTKKNHFQSVDVVLRGTFRVARQGECFGQNCLQYEIESHELMCARASQEGQQKP